MTTDNKNRKMKVGICGAGPCGLTLASILSKEGDDNAFDITIFERGSASRDQGSGWDLNSDAKVALSRAGVDPSYIQREGSDAMRFYKVQQGHTALSYCMRMPPILEDKVGLTKQQIGLDELGLESERNKMIDGLMSALGDNVTVNHDCYVSGLKKDTDGRVELLGRDGLTYGKYDLIIDASGINSPVRNARFSSEADAFYTGQTWIQGKLDSPEKSLDPKIVERLGEGTSITYGPSFDKKGTEILILQRYGAKKKDQMTTVSLVAYNDKPDDLAKELGYKGHGNTSEEDMLKSVSGYAKSQLSNEGWPEEYRDIWDSISGVRVLPIKMHPSTAETMKHEVPGSDVLPFIGIGDALHGMPPWSGMSGNMALADASDLASDLLKEQKTDWSPSSIANLMRTNEQVFMERTDEKRAGCVKSGEYSKKYISLTPVQDFTFISQILGEEFSWFNPIAVCIAGYLRILTLLNRLDNYGIQPAKQ